MTEAVRTWDHHQQHRAPMALAHSPPQRGRGGEVVAAAAQAAGPGAGVDVAQRVDVAEAPSAAGELRGPAGRAAAAGGCSRALAIAWAGQRLRHHAKGQAAQVLQLHCNRRAGVAWEGWRVSGSGSGGGGGGSGR